jgi:hypothetical protein
MEIPFRLRQTCVEFLLEALGEQLMSPHGQRRLIEQSGLPRDIVSQIPMGEPPLQFVTLLVAVLCEIPLEPDERDPLPLFLQSLFGLIPESHRPQLEHLLQQLGNEQPVTPPTPAPIPSPPPRRPSAASSFPAALQHKIVEFLRALPDIALPERQQALIKAARLDSNLQWQISVGKSPQEFSLMLVTTLKAYGCLADGRDPVEAILKASKSLIPEQQQADCDRLIALLNDL